MSDEVKKLNIKQTGAYLKLLGIYEGNVSISDDQSKDAFLIHVGSIDGVEFIVPVYVEPIYVDSVRNQLKRLRPLHLAFENLPQTQPESKKRIIDINTVPDDNVEVGIDIADGDDKTITKH